VIRTGRNFTLDLAIALIPVAGSIAYLIAEVCRVSSAAVERNARRRRCAGHSTHHRDLRRYSNEVKLSGKHRQPPGATPTS